MLTLREVVARALADAGERRVVLGSGLANVQGPAPLANGHGELPDVALVRVTTVTPKGDGLLEGSAPAARELWAVVVPEPGAPAFVESLACTEAARVARVYHPVAVADVGERGLVVRKVLKGKSAREVADLFGIPCLAGPDLAEWRAPA